MYDVIFSVSKFAPNKTAYLLLLPPKVENTSKGPVLGHQPSNLVRKKKKLVKKRRKRKNSDLLTVHLFDKSKISYEVMNRVDGDK